MIKVLLTAWMVLGLTVTGWCGVFKDNGNFTVTDLATGRTWQQRDDNVTRNWDDAVSYCQGLSLGGSGDWRLPDIKELRSIIDGRVSYLAIDTDVFPGTNSGPYWSATTFAPNSGYAWSVSLNGGTTSFPHKSFPYYVRCVR